MTGYQSKRAMARDKVTDIDGHVVRDVRKPKKAAAQESVAWMVYTQDGQSVYVTDNPTNIQEGQRFLPLYTTPPAAQRPWVDLTDEETSGFTQHEMSVVKYVSKVLKDKNT